MLAQTQFFEQICIFAKYVVEYIQRTYILFLYASDGWHARIFWTSGRISKKNWELFLNLTKMQWGHEGVKHIFFAYILAVF